MKKWKIALVNFNLRPGGTERYFSELANYLEINGYEVTIILLKKDDIFFRINTGVQILEPEVKYGSSTYLKFLYFIKIVFFLRKSIADLRPSVIINAAFPSFFLFSTLGMKVPVVTAIRCDPRKVKLIEGVKIPDKLRQVLYKRNSAIIAQTSFAAKILGNQFNNLKTITIPNILNTGLLTEQIRENIIVSAGRLNKNKGFDYLIRSFHKVNPENWKLIILGEGPEKQNLIDLIEFFHMEDKVFLPGYKVNVHEYFGKSKIFAFTSLSEGFPNVLLEAMATPLACISFDIDSGPRDLITNGRNGFLVETKDIDDFAAKLKLLVNNHDLREEFMAEAVHVRETYDINKTGILYIDLINSLIR